MSEKVKGNQAFKKGNFNDAIAHYRKYVEHDHDDNQKAYTNIAISYFKLKNFWKSIEACNQAIAIDEKLKKGYYRRFMARKQLICIHEHIKNQSVLDDDSDTVSDAEFFELVYGVYYDLRLFIKNSDDKDDSRQIGEMQEFWEKYKPSMFEPVSVKRSKLGADGLQIIVDVNEIEKQCIEGLAMSWSETPFVGKQKNMDRIEIMRKKIEAAKKMPLIKQVNSQSRYDIKSGREQQLLRLNDQYSEMNDLMRNSDMTTEEKQCERSNIQGQIKKLKEEMLENKQISQITIGCQNEEIPPQSQKKPEVKTSVLQQSPNQQQQVQESEQPNLQKPEQKQEVKTQVASQNTHQMMPSQSPAQKQLPSSTETNCPYENIFLKAYNINFDKTHEQFNAFWEGLHSVIESSLPTSQKQKLLSEQIPNKYKGFKIHVKGLIKKQKEALSKLMASNQLEHLAKLYTSS